MLNFSPIVEIASFILSSTVLPLDNLDSIKASTVSTLLSKIWLAISLTNSWKPSLRATKSVSELISTIAASLSFYFNVYKTFCCDTVSFLAAFAIPFHVSSQSLYRCHHQFQLALLQSIIPAPVFHVIFNKFC